MKLCEDIDTDTWSKGYKIVIGKLGLRSPLTLSDAQQMLARELFPEGRVKALSNLDINEADLPNCTRQEIMDAGQRIKTGKAAGFEGIPPEIIKVICDLKPRLLEAIANNKKKQKFSQ
ncbi:unnamed protein product [Psylliodes chrysocephalus]|uniref:Uncharacterized protein n=1 Tax=Psylliodes chrysocephalus TaxID=3402493 RepID=A0A9P0GJ38_9CUCU|nr:unnamed protein product [Psylliodes chrysocephala]